MPYAAHTIAQQPARASPAFGTPWARSTTCARARCSKRTKSAASPAAAAQDPAARHGPYYRVGAHEGRQARAPHVSAQQAAVLRHAIDNYRKVKKLLRDWEVETERLIDAEAATSKP